MENLSPFEQGVLLSLAAMAATLRSTPGFDAKAMEDAASYFIENPAAGCESGTAKDAYEWPLSILKMNLDQLQNWMIANRPRH